jgi:hypothetical protein
MALREFRHVIEASDWDAFIALEEVGWPEIAREMVLSPGSEVLKLRFHTQWVTHGARIRAAVSDDQLLANALRAWLPAYVGPPLMLYRGESAEREAAFSFGFCWTPRKDVAEMFAGGWQALYPGGGVLLGATIASEALIAGPNDHSNYLGEEEYVVDPAGVKTWTVLQRFPQAKSTQ